VSEHISAGNVSGLSEWGAQSRQGRAHLPSTAHSCVRGLGAWCGAVWARPAPRRLHAGPMQSGPRMGALAWRWREPCPAPFLRAPHLPLHPYMYLNIPSSDVAAKRAALRWKRVFTQKKTKFRSPKRGPTRPYPVPSSQSAEYVYIRAVSIAEVSKGEQPPMQAENHGGSPTPRVACCGHAGGACGVINTYMMLDSPCLRVAHRHRAAWALRRVLIRSSLRRRHASLQCLGLYCLCTSRQ
jgi:hypothetical protein